MNRKKFDAIRTCGIMPPMEVSLWHDRVKLKKRLAERGQDIKLMEGFPAQTFVAEIDGDKVHFVLMEPSEGVALHEQMALLAHEATHIASRYFDIIGEDEPAEEEWAYAVQSACSCLFDAHLSWREGKVGQ